jgi:MFS family permease
MVWVIGPGTAAALQASSGTSSVFGLVAGLLLIGALVVLVGVRDVPHVAPALDPSSDPSAVLGPDGAPIDPSRALRELARRRPVQRALLATVVWLAAVGVLAAFLRDAVLAVGASESLVGALFSAYAIVAALVMLSPLAGRVDEGRAEHAIVAGLACIGVALLAMTGADGLWQLGAASALFGAGYGLVFPAATGAISLAASTATRGRAFGLFNAAFSLGLALGPPLAGALAAAVPALDPPFLPTGIVVLVTAAAIALTRGPSARSTEAAAR